MFPVQQNEQPGSHSTASHHSACCDRAQDLGMQQSSERLDFLQQSNPKMKRPPRDAGKAVAEGPA